MNVLRNSVPVLGLGVLLSGVVVAPAAADTLLTFGGMPAKVTWDRYSGSTGRLFAGTTYGGSTVVDILAPPEVVEPAVNWSFSADFVAGSSAWVMNTTTTKIKTASFNNGSFSFTGAQGLLVSGTFTDGTLVSNNGSLMFTVLNSNVTYAPGTVMIGNPNITGDFAFSLVNHRLGMSGWAQSGGNITATTFSGNAGGSVEVTGSPALGGSYTPSSAVPEPGEWAAMGILGAGLAGLVVKKRRSASR